MKLFQQHSFLYKVSAIPIDLIVIATVMVLCSTLPSRLIEKKFRNNSEYFSVETNLRKKKWLLCCSCNPRKNSISTHIDFLRRELYLHSSNYESFITLILLLGDFNSEMTDSNLKDFCNLYLLKKLIKKPTCFKNPENPKTIDLILTNRPPRRFL